MQLNELFKKLVDSELLTEETKKTLETEFNTLLEEAIKTKVEEAKKETEEKVRLELTEQFVADKEALIEALDTKASEFLDKELAEYDADVERFRNLEVEKEEQLAEAKAEMAATVKKDMATLVDRLDEFLEQRLDVEFAELKESIEEVKKLEFGRKIYEAVAAEYASKYVNNDATAVELKATQSKLQESVKVLEAVTKELSAAKREQKLASVLETLQGRPREVMEAILKNVPTDKIEENYNKFIGRVLHESVTSKVEDSAKSEKENASKASVLAEGKDHSKGEEAATKVVTGDTPVVEDVSETKEKTSLLSESDKDRLKKLAGIID